MPDTPKPSTMDDLIAKLEAAVEGNPFLDMGIARAIGWTCPGADPPTWPMDPDNIYDWWGVNWFGADGKAHGTVRDFPFTTSLDAALTLVPEGMSVMLDITPGKTFCSVHDNSGLVGSPDGENLSPPLTLCIAALKARSAK